MANESINLNLIPTGEMPVIHVSQFDNGRQFNINLFKGNDEYTLPSGYTATLNCRKADRNIVTLATTSVLSNALTFTTTTQLCACAGKNLCEVVIKDAEDYQVGTLNFILEVERDPLQGGIESTSEIHDLEDQIEDITTEIISENYYTKTETDTLLDAKANASDVYTKTQVDTALSAKADTVDVYTKTEVDTALSAKANTADVYTKSQVDTALSAKANAADVYTKTEVDTALELKADKSNTYTKVQTDAVIAASIFDIMPIGSVSSSPIASFETNLPVPYQSVTVNVVATGGNGTPDNPISINGYTEANITRCGVNLCNTTLTSTSSYDVDFTVNADKSITVNGTASGTFILSITGQFTLREMGIRAGVDYFLSGCPAGGSGSTYRIQFSVSGSGTEPIDYGNGVVCNFSESDLDKTYQIIFYINSGTQLNNLTFYPQLVIGSIAVPYAPYNGNTYTIAFGQTVYGGVLDVTSGKLKPCVEYPSYNGETLSGRWLSSEATYIEGTTPPIGSQVVSLDDYATDIDLTPVQISAIIGVNNVFADCGKTEVKYKDTIQHYIDSRT